jgi:hypothetical protein
MSGIGDLMIGSSLSAGRRVGHAPSALNAISGQADWNSTLQRAVSARREEQAPESDPRMAGIRSNVEELVARTLIAPVLASLHNNPLKSDLFPETPGSKALAPLLEAEVAKSMASSMGGSLVDQVARRLLNQLDATSRAKDGAGTLHESARER